MYFDLPSHDVDQLDLPISPHGHYYINFAPLHPSERLRTFYSTNTQPQKEVWPRKRITKIVGHGRKVKGKFDLECLLYKYFIS